MSSGAPPPPFSPHSVTSPDARADASFSWSIEHLSLLHLTPLSLSPSTLHRDTPPLNMRVKDPVETFDDYVLLEIFAHVPPEDVVRASYNTSRRWRALITRLKLCKPIFFGLSNVNTADPYVLRQRAQCDHRFGESTKVNWRAHCRFTLARNRSPAIRRRQHVSRAGMGFRQSCCSLVS